MGLRYRTGKKMKCLLGILLPLLLLAQTPEPPTATLRADTTLVLVPVTVTDPLNRFVVGLRKNDFRLLEDDKEQKVTHFSGEDAPLSVGIVVDTSGSMDLKLQRSRMAVKEFLKTMNAQDEALLVEFNDSVTLRQGFTSDFDQISAKVDQLEPKGLTALFDALQLALKEMKSAKNPRKAVLLITDGGDNNSRFTATDVTNLVRESDTQIFAIGVFEPTLRALTKAELSGPELLNSITQQTGGRAYPAKRISELPALAARVGIDLRNQYVLGYSPSKQDRDGKYRKVQVQITAPAGLPALKASWRLGYYAPTP